MASGNEYIGKVIGNYRIVQIVSSGAFGSVYLAEHTILTGRIVAIKLLHSALAGSQNAELDRFLQEARLLEKLRHPYILATLDAGVYEISPDGSIPYIMTEYAPNGSLRDRIRRQYPDLLPLSEVLTILSQIGKGLQYIHQQKIIHRDLKPENILFNADEEALLADFGIAIIADIEPDEHTMGTFAYMAPEQFQGKSSRKSDQYSLGCIAYELVTGHVPFSGSVEQVRYKHLYELPIAPRQFNPQLPVYIEQAILKAMAKNPEDRHRNVAAFISALYTSHKTKEEWLEEGNVHYRAKHYQEALAALEQAIRLDPNFAPAYNDQGAVLRTLRRYQEALAAFEQAIQLDPKLAFAYHGKGLALGGLERYEEALNAHEQAIRLDPNLAYPHNGKGYVLLKLQRYEEALAAFEQAIQLDPNFDLPYYNKGNVLSDLQRYEEAIADYDQAIELNPEYAAAYNNRGWAYYQLEEYQRAIQDYERAIELDPTYAVAYNNRGLAYADLKEYHRAIQDYERAIELDPTYADAYNRRGFSYYNLKQYQQAIADYNRAIELDPNKVSAYYNRATAYYELKEYQQSIADLDRAIVLDETYSWAIAQRGETYRLMERYEEALADFDRAIALDENYAWAIGSRGQTYRLLGRYQEALADLDRAITLDGTTAWIFAERGETYRLLEHYQEALADFDQALELDPSYTSAWYNKGNILSELQRYDAALKSYEQALILHQQVGDRLGEADVLKAIGGVQQLRDDRETALAFYERSLSIYQELGDMHGIAVTQHAMADVQVQQGQVEEAITLYQQALALYRQVGDRAGQTNVLEAMPQLRSSRFEVFISYAHEDEEFRNELVTHLDFLKRQGLIHWHDRKIDVGTSEIDTHLNTAQIILLLISASFLESDLCYEVEMKRAMERHNAGEARVIPIILRPLDWMNTPIGILQALPLNARPLSTWQNRSEAFSNVARGIQEVIEELNTSLVGSAPSFGTESTASAPTKAIEIFYSYADADEELVDKLEKELTRLERQGFITNWHHRKVHTASK